MHHHFHQFHHATTSTRIAVVLAGAVAIIDDPCASSLLTATPRQAYETVYNAIDNGWDFGLGHLAASEYTYDTPVAGWNICSRNLKEYGFFETVCIFDGDVFIGNGRALAGFRKGSKKSLGVKASEGFSGALSSTHLQQAQWSKHR